MANEQDNISSCVLNVLEFAKEGNWNEARIYWMTKVVDKQETVRTLLLYLYIIVFLHKPYNLVIKNSNNIAQKR